VRIVAERKGESDDIPDWPQPQGIRTRGTHFHSIEFLKTLQDMYERYHDLSMEYGAFVKVLQRRVTVDEDGSVLLRLCGLLMLPPGAQRAARTKKR
jgi:hypothetical protein